MSVVILLLMHLQVASSELKLQINAPSNAANLSDSQIKFEVYRKGEKVGFHNVEFKLIGDELNVDSTFQIEIDFLFFTAFKFYYHSESRWKNGLLTSLKATINDDGKTSFVTLSREENLIYVKNSIETYTVPTPLFPTNHWNPDVLQEKRVLNTLTGQINNVNIKLLGNDDVITENGKIKANYYRYTGDLNTEVWYDADSRWVKMRFEGKDGSKIEYRCIRCQGSRIMNNQL